MTVEYCHFCGSREIIDYRNKTICGFCNLFDPKIDAVMESWARWRVSGIEGTYSNGETLIARMMRCMRSIKCPTCKGSGKEKRKNYLRTRAMKICSFCRGKGEIDMTRRDDKVNPALISGSGYVKNMPDNPQSEAVDRAFNQCLTPFEQLIIQLEYCTPGTQIEKAGRVEIGKTKYWRELKSARVKIKDYLRGPKVKAA